MRSFHSVVLQETRGKILLADFCFNKKFAIFDVCLKPQNGSKWVYLFIKSISDVDYLNWGVEGFSALFMFCRVWVMLLLF